ncbi:MAG: hypothetical protein JWP74_909 [Marmoricola sp.]|nr:hypothetical protein [Marmoricola sp.]
MTTRRSTLDGLQDGSPAIALLVRRLVLVLILVAVILDLGGVLGEHTGSVSRTSGGYTLTLEYPSTGRAGLDARWRVHLSHPGGFGKELTLAVTGDYFDIFESQGFFPEPSAETRDGKVLYMTFDAPTGNTFELDYDAYIQPASQQGHQGHLALLRAGDGSPEVVGLDYTTRLVP